MLLTQERAYTGKNKLKFRVATDLHETRKLWEHFSPHLTIDDEWDFRYAFYKYLKFPLFFLTAYDSNKPVGLLPLQFNTGKGFIPESYQSKGNFFEFFGGDDTDSNSIFLSKGYEHLVPFFLRHLPTTAILAPLAEPYKFPDNEAANFTDRYITRLQNFDDFVEVHFDKKDKKKLDYKMRRLRRHFRIDIQEGTKEDLELLFHLNQQRFGGSSSFRWEYRKQIFRDLYEQFPSDLFVILFDGVKKAVSFSLVHKKVYVEMNIGYDHSIRDLGKLMAVSQIQRAIQLGCTVFDAGKGNSGWKEQFGLRKIPQYMLKLHSDVQTRDNYLDQ